MKESKLIATLLDHLDEDAIFDLLDHGLIESSCPYHNGSDTTDWFEEGLDLGRAAAGRDIYVYYHHYHAFYFIGTETEIVNRLEENIVIKLPDSVKLTK